MDAENIENKIEPENRGGYSNLYVTIRGAGLEI
jgi:hypothetical protein